MRTWLKGLFEIQHTAHATLYSMEGLRGFAVFLVFLVHYITLSDPWIVESESLYEWASIVRSLGNVGVDLFFVLSGHLIYGSLIKRERPFIPYLRRRIERIYPTFVAVFFLYLALSYLFPQESKIPNDPLQATRYLAENFLLLPGMVQIEPLITVAWSLSYEFFFYLSVPLLIFILRLRFWPSMSRILFFSALGGSILTAPELFGNHVRLAMFISGMLVYELSTQFRSPRYLDIAGLLGLLFALTGTIAHKTVGFSGQWKFAILSVSFFLLCWACFSANGYASKIFRWTPMRWLGNISYSYYLIHGLVLKGIFLFTPSFVAATGHDIVLFWAGMFFCFVATFIVSTVLFSLVEKPFSLSVRAKVTASGNRKDPKVSTT